jgi:hypothetical protein
MCEYNTSKREGTFLLLPDFELCSLLLKLMIKQTKKTNPGEGRFQMKGL